MPLATAEPISNSGRVSGKIYEKRKNTAAQLHMEEMNEDIERNSSADSKFSEEKGERGAPGITADIPL